MKKIFSIILFLTLISASLFLALIKFQYQKLNTAAVCFKEDCFEVEIAKTAPEQHRGLMFKTQLERGKGMLFVYDSEGNYPFWMKNTLISLDMIWINQNHEVVYIAENAESCKEFCLEINPQKNAQYILEINGGLAKELGINVGDKAVFDL